MAVVVVSSNSVKMNEVGGLATLLMMGGVMRVPNGFSLAVGEVSCTSRPAAKPSNLKMCLFPGYAEKIRFNWYKAYVGVRRNSYVIEPEERIFTSLLKNQPAVTIQ